MLFLPLKYLFIFTLLQLSTKNVVCYHGKKIRTGEHQYRYILPMFNFRLCLKLNITYIWKRPINNNYYKIPIYSLSPFFISIYLNF